VVLPDGSRSSDAAAAERELVERGVDARHVDDADALGHGHEDVPSSTWAGGGPSSGCVGAVGETGEVALGGLKCGGNARPVHGTGQHLCQDVVAQRGLCSQGGAPHGVMGVRAAKGGSAAALCKRGRGHGEWLVSSGLPRGETHKSICTSKAAKGRLLSQKPIDTVFGVKKHGWRRSKGGRLRLAFLLDQVKIQTLRARSSRVCIAAQPAQKLEELIVNAPVTGFDELARAAAANIIGDILVHVGPVKVLAGGACSVRSTPGWPALGTSWWSRSKSPFTASLLGT
jgi:hypothetical protein